MVNDAVHHGSCWKASHNAYVQRSRICLCTSDCHANVAALLTQDSEIGFAVQRLRVSARRRVGCAFLCILPPLKSVLPCAGESYLAQASQCHSACPYGANYTACASQDGSVIDTGLLLTVLTIDMIPKL